MDAETDDSLRSHMENKKKAIIFLQLKPCVRVNMFYDKLLWIPIYPNTTLKDIKMQFTNEDLGLNLDASEL